MSRLIDADANIETMKKCAENPENAQALLCYRYAQRILEEAPTVEPASPWHRGEELPKEVGCYLVVGFDRYWFYDIAEYFPIDNEWVMSENQPDSTYIRYWTPLPEPPKEDADGN